MARRAFALILLGVATPALASAGPDGFEDLTKLEGRVVGALDADVGQLGGPVTHLDRRLKLQPCPTPATIDPPALGAVAVRCEAIGWRIRVPLMRAATPSPVPVAYAAAPAQPQTPPVIKRGDPVQLVAESGGFSVSTEAVAQEDGRIGGRIRVKTDPVKGAVVVGEVIDTGRVRVSSF